MSESSGAVPEPPAAANPKAATPARPEAGLASGTYEILRQRLRSQAAILEERMRALDARRREVFGSVKSEILKADRITTAHHCVPRDMVRLTGNRFLFGFNVHFGLKREVDLGDVFALYERDESTGSFRECGLEAVADPRFVQDFKRLYNVYQGTTFRKFSVVENRLYMVFQTGKGLNDIAVFRWVLTGTGFEYGDGRAEQEYRQAARPAQHPFSWRAPGRESFRYGDHPHVSIEDRVFVECIGGDLTIKVEDNTATGEGLYSEPVEDRNQKVDDAQIGYATVGPLVVLQVRPYKEKVTRYFIYNAKVQQVDRVDRLGESCAVLPEDHGLIFPDGYYLTTGELKRFESREGGLALERVIHSPNGEDSLFVFYGAEQGVYVLMPYRLIAQQVEERIVCHGFSLFAGGELLLFHADPEPQKHHLVQLRRTPFHEKGHEPAGQREAFLYQVGNKPVVRCLAECTEVLSLARREEPYAELYDDLVRRCGAILDAYPWLRDAEGFGVDEAVVQVREAADRAVDEFEKVRRLRREAVERLQEGRARVDEALSAIRRARFAAVADYVGHLATLRRLRGELLALRDVPHLDVAQVGSLEASIAERATELGAACVKFLLQPDALEPYRRRATEQLAAVESVGRVAEGRKLEETLSGLASDLEMLIEVVNGLGIVDAAETARIIDGITGVYATLNQARAALKKRLQALVAAEGAARFEAQMKLIGQSAASFLDLCDSPAKCDEYLNRLSVQLEELEGTFADLQEYTIRIAERRAELYEAFEQRKLALVEQRTRRAAGLMEAAERILKVIRTRLSAFNAIEEIHAYTAADPMVAKVRDIVAQLLALEDPVRADDLEGRLKAAQQDAVRQLKDRQELFVGGANVIQLGRHRFNVNTQGLDLTLVQREGVPHLHLTGTQYFEPVTDGTFLGYRDVWDLEFVSESAEVYRAEYLARLFLRSLMGSSTTVPGKADREGVAGEATAPAGLRPADVLALGPAERLDRIQAYMATRYQEGYAKGIHDHDALLIFEVLAEMHDGLRLARYPGAARACALVYWHRFCAPEVRDLWSVRLAGVAGRHRLFPGDTRRDNVIRELRALLEPFVATTGLFAAEVVPPAAEYWFHEMVGGGPRTVSREADVLERGFLQHLSINGAERVFAEARAGLKAHPAAEWELVRDWMRGFAGSRGDEGLAAVDEAAAAVFCGLEARSIVDAATSRVIEGFRGSHPRVAGGRCTLSYPEFEERLGRHEGAVAPRFEQWRRLKQQVLDEARGRLRLEEFRPRVLTSFVRNQLIDRVYLPLLGDNLAKQVGTAGEQKRTDRMGLLLVVSPPGYGKTTLLEYLASRLGMVFVKINGPALGHEVTSLDPEDAPNTSARGEIERLNLALEMGDNVMLCVDDIQHCHPEFLQRFIPLCDAQRRIEGVWGGRPRAYDLRGRKVAVVMAGNPYTESGLKFKIPDMLANRADTYNLGDIVGGHAAAFRTSFLENAVTSNTVLAPVGVRSQSDIRLLIGVAESGGQDVQGLQGAYSPAELGDILAVLRHLMAIRDVIMRVNEEYIRSAAQADEFRTEPPFRLQGSYRNMNRLAEKVVPVMTREEVWRVIEDHYRGEAQTLTTGAEANLLKFREITGTLSPEDAARWEDIQKTFRRNQVTRGADTSDPAGRVVAQLAAFHTTLDGIRDMLAEPKAAVAPSVVVDLAPVARSVDGIREELLRALRQVPAGSSSPGDADRVASLTHELEMLHSTLASLKDLASQQRDQLRSAVELLATRARQGTVEFELTQDMLNNERAFLDRFYQVLSATRSDGREPPSGSDAGLMSGTPNP